MEIHIEGIREDLLAAAAALGDEKVTDGFRRLADTVEPSMRLRIIDLLAEVALKLNVQLDYGHVEVRMAGREPELVYVDEPAAEDEPPAPGRRPQRPHHAAPARRAQDGPRGRRSARGDLRQRLDRPGALPSARAARRAAFVEPAPGLRPELTRTRGAPMFSYALFGPADPDPVERRRPRRRGDQRVDSRPSIPARLGRS